jgi:uncharacterized repeat protein (TIGR03806 family)
LTNDRVWKILRLLLIMNLKIDNSPSFYCLVLACWLWLGLETKVQAQSYGLDTLAPIGKFLDNKLPATTPGGAGTAQPPALLSQVAAFSNLSTLTPRSGLIPYTVNSPLWTDGASKQRWLAVPNDGTADTAAEKITFTETGAWQFPKGSVLVKQFDLPTDDRNSAVQRRMETRFLVHGEDGVYYGITYRWRADGLDADLLPDGDSVTLAITTNTGGTRSQTWSFPSRADCRTCHNAGAGILLGTRTHQMNGTALYPVTGRADNQLRALNHLNLFSPVIGESAIPTYAKTVAVADLSATLEHRVRSYLEANCAHCHYPGNAANPAGFDARFSTPIASSNIIGGSPLYDLGLANARIVVPQNTSSSVMYYRMSVNGLHQMPPIGRNTVDTAAVGALAAWINGLPVLPPPSTNQSPVAVNDEVSTLLNAAVDIPVLVNDNDPDGDALTVSSPSVPTAGTLVALSGNIYRYTPPNGFTGGATFQYTLLDGRGGSAAATVTVRVLPPATSNSVAFFDGSSRLSAPTSYGGVAMGVADMNQDGLDDVVHLRTATQLRIDYQSPAGAVFSFREVGTATSGNQWGLCLGDADNNGYPDILVGGFYDGLKYYRANSNATAYSVTTLSSPSIFSQSLGFADINRDGWLDIFACHDEGESARFRNTGNGSMVVDASLINARTVLPSDNSGNYGIVWTDYDNDGDSDLYLSKCRLGVSSSSDPRRINQLFRNNGNGTYTDVAAAAGLAFGEQSWTADFADIDNDGDMDCYVGNHGAGSYLMRNNGNGTFTNISTAAGMGSVNWMIIQSIFRDFNNDGYVDLLLTGQQQQMWINQRNSTFSLMANPFNSRVMESCAVGDLNKDGFTDIYAGYATMYNTPAVSRPDKLFLAQNNGNNFLSVTLRGVASNATASGARLELYGPWGVQLREVRSGEGYAITNSFTQLFGMGNTGAATRLRVRWPSGYVEEALNVLPNRFLTLREGSMAAPSLTSPGNQTHFRGAAVDFTLTASDPTGDTLTYTASGLPAGLSITSTTGRITGTIANSALSNYTTVLSVTDGWSTAARSITWSINGATAPGVTLATNSGTVSAAFDVSVNFTAAVTGLTSSDFIVANGSVIQLTGSVAAYTARINPTAAGVVTVSLPANAVTAVSGGIGNSASVALPVNFIPLDTTKPSVTLTTPSAIVSGAFTVTATFSEAVSGLSAGELSVTNGTASAPTGSGSSYSWSVTPSTYGNITAGLPAGSVNDAAGNTNTASNTLSVSWPQPNRAPVVSAPGGQTSLRGAAATLAIQGSDPDGQSLTWTMSGQPLGLSINASTGVISGTISASAAASYNVTVSASDGFLSASVSFTWGTTAPVAATNGLRAEYYSGLEPGVGIPLLVRTDANVDFDWGSGSPAPSMPIDYFSARWTGTLTAPYSEVYTFWVPSDNGVRLWINNVQVLNKWTPSDIAGWHTFDLALTGNQAVPIKLEYSELYGGANITLYWYSASQAWEAINTSRFRTASAVNQAPVVTNPGTQTALRGRTAWLTLQATDPDFNPLTWSATGLPSGLSINPSTGVISGTVSLSAASSNSVNVSVSDGSLSASINFIWNTNAPPANAAPVAYDPGNQTSIRGSIVTMSPMATDPDGDVLTWSANQLPAGLSINASTGLISGTVLTTAATSYGATLTVRDPAGLTASVSFTWNTTAPPLHGLRAEFFDGMVPGAAAPILVRTDATIDFDWGGGSPAPGIPVDYFSARWTGSLTAPFTETYTIYVPSDNGVRVWLNNQLILDKWSPADISGWHNFTIPLVANQAIPIKVEYAELYGGANISIYWYSNSQPWEAINTNRLTPATILPPNSAEATTSLVSRTQRLETSPNLGSRFTFRRPSSSANLLALIVEESHDLATWSITDRPAQVVQLNDGTEEIMVPVPTPGVGSAECACFYRVRFLVP